MKIKKVEAFKSSDGKLFFDKHQAQQHEMIIEMKRLVAREFELDAQNVAKFIVINKYAISNIFNKEVEVNEET